MYNYIGVCPEQSVQVMCCNFYFCYSCCLRKLMGETRSISHFASFACALLCYCCLLCVSDRVTVCL